MRNSIRLALALLALASAAKSAKMSDLMGVWKGSLDSLPAVTLTLDRDGGNLTGAILFYLIRRSENGKETASVDVPEPLLQPKFDGKALTFWVSHKRAHQPRTLNDPPVEFKLELQGSKAAVLISREAPPLKMTKTD